MKIGVLGTGMVAQAVAGKLAALGHSVMIGTRDPSATLARSQKDGTGNPPFRVWKAKHPAIDLGTFATARGTEMYLPLWLRLFGAVGSPMVSIKVVR